VYLRRRDLGLMLGFASRISLDEEAGEEEARNRQRENQRYWCDVSGSHGEVQPMILLRGDKGGKAAVSARRRTRWFDSFSAPHRSTTCRR
jgi:hypothetical protein